MKLPRSIVVSVLALACCVPWFSAQWAFGAEGPPVRQTLRIPVLVVQKGKPLPGLRCVVHGRPFVPQSAVAFSPDGKLLAASGYGEVLLWDLEKATLARRLSDGNLGSSIGALVFLKGGALLAAGSGEPDQSGSVVVFDVQSGSAKSAFTEPEDTVLSLAVSPDGKLLAAGSADNRAYVWSLEDGKLVTTITDHSGWVLDVAFSADGKYLATAGADRVLRVWDTAEWRYAATYVEEDAVRSVVFVPDGRTLLLAIGGSQTRYLQARQLTNVRYRRSVSAGGGLLLDTLSWFQAHHDWVYAMALESEGKRLATASADGTVKLWDPVEKRLLATLVQLAPQSDQWLIVAEPGYVCTSAAGRLAWRGVQGTQVPDGLAELLNKPELVREALAGGTPKPAEIR